MTNLHESHKYIKLEFMYYFQIGVISIVIDRCIEFINIMDRGVNLSHVRSLLQFYHTLEY